RPLNKLGRIERGHLDYCDRCASVQCAECKRPIVKRGSSIRPGIRYFCHECRHLATHAKRPPILCRVCGSVCNRSASMRARKAGAKEWGCSEHPMPVGVAPTLEPCATCGEPATQESSRRARYRRKSGKDPQCKAYCPKHFPGQGARSADSHRKAWE